MELLLLCVCAVAVGVAIGAARLRGEFGRPRRASGVPRPPHVARNPLSYKGLYAVLWHDWTGGVDGAWWKIGQGDIRRRISAHTSAVGHPRMVVAWIECDDHVDLEREVFRDLARWKREAPTIPGEELYDADPRVEAYLRELFRGGKWEDKR